MQNKTTPIAQAQEAEHPNDCSQSPKELSHPIPSINSWLQRLFESNEIVPMPNELGITYMLKGNRGYLNSYELRAIADYLDELEHATAYNQSEEMKGIPEF